VGLAGLELATNRLWGPLGNPDSLRLGSAVIALTQPLAP
jgi:hypothetical protein